MRANARWTLLPRYTVRARNPANESEDELESKGERGRPAMPPVPGSQEKQRSKKHDNGVKKNI